MNKVAILFSTCFFLLFTSLAFSTEYSGALSASHLSASGDSADSETIAIIDLDVEGEVGSGRWHAYIEGTSTSKNDHVSDVYGESYADAGAAADENGDGRIQISNLEYYHPVGNGELVVGLIYPSGFTESGEWTNDETTQFIGSSFVNIQTSANPDYALGIGYTNPLSDELSFSILLSQAQGLGDLDGRYSSLFDELDDYFIASELAWSRNDTAIHASIWTSTLDEDNLNGSGTSNNHGINLSLAQTTPLGLLVLRYGVANDEVSAAESFLGISLQKAIEQWSFGMGTSRTYANKILKNMQPLDDIKQSELYIRYNFNQNIHGTLSYQKISNSGFGDLEVSDISPSVTTLRISYEF